MGKHRAAAVTRAVLTSGERDHCTNIEPDVVDTQAPLPVARGILARSTENNLYLRAWQYAPKSCHDGAEFHAEVDDEGDEDSTPSHEQRHRGRHPITCGALWKVAE